MNKEYLVTIMFKATMDYSIEAKSKNEAEEIAKTLFEDCDLNECNSIDWCDVVDIVEY